MTYKIMLCMMTMVMVMVMALVVTKVAASSPPDYGEALSKSILFYEGQRSGKLPPNQRLTWRKDSGLRDGFAQGILDRNIEEGQSRTQNDRDAKLASVDLVGGYYDAGDNVKFNFPMAFSTSMLAWSVLEFGESMGPELQHALEAIRWSTDYFVKCTSIPGIVFAQVGDPHTDHNCWERPEDMDTPRMAYAVSKISPGSEVSAEIAAALAASSVVFKHFDHKYSRLLLQRAIQVFNFADKYQGSYNDSIGPWVCPFYCNFGGYQDELIWGAAWLHKATKLKYYWNYITKNINKVQTPRSEGNFAEFGWDTKNPGINILVSKFVLNNSLHSSPFLLLADKFVCSVLPESLSPSVTYSPGGLLFKPGMVNMQHTTGLSFLLLVYARYLRQSNRVIACDNFVATPSRLIYVAKGQVDYILGKNPMNMSYMVGYGEKFPQRVHHRASSLPSMDEREEPIECKHGTPYIMSNDPNPNLLVGAVVGGPDISDKFADERTDAFHSEPTTYVNAPLVGLLAYFKAHIN